MDLLPRKRDFLTFTVILSFMFGLSCQKEEVPGDVFTDNDAPYYDRIPTVLVQNYVNRLYIDLIGREPLDVEMDAEVERLKENNLSFESRDSLINALQSDETFREKDSSYKHAYYIRLYELFKVKMLEGASDGDINRERGMIYGNLIRDSLKGDWYNLAINLEKIRKLDAVLDINENMRDGKIEIKHAFARLLNNEVYDMINMNTFNFLRASFQDLFDRFPTDMEFDNGFEIVEYNRPAIIFGQSANDKGQYIEILVNSKEFYEGMIRWTYGTLLAREATAQEIDHHMETFYVDHDLAKLQLEILRTDEYANFN